MVDEYSHGRHRRRQDAAIVRCAGTIGVLKTSPQRSAPGPVPYQSEDAIDERAFE